MKGLFGRKQLKPRDNFDLIAMNTVLILNGLEEKYASKFSSIESMYAMAGIIDAEAYVLNEKTIPIDSIVEGAEKACKRDEPLLNFILYLEYLIFCADTPEISDKEIFLALMSKEGRIEKFINYSLENGSDALLNLSVRRFMEEPDFIVLRKYLNVKDPDRLQ